MSRRALRKHRGTLGEICLSARYATLRNKLVITVNGCRYRLTHSTTWTYFVSEKKKKQGEQMRAERLAAPAHMLRSPHRDIFACSENGTDSYVRLYLLPDQTWRHRKRTHVKKRTVNPVFEEKYTLALLLNTHQ